MGRPIEFDREAAIAAALDELWHDGLQKPSINQLAEKLGITRSSLYNSFKDRDGLVIAAMEHYGRIAPDSEFFTSSPTKPVRQIITDIVLTVCRVNAADETAKGCFFVNAICSSAPQPDDTVYAYLISRFAASIDIKEQLINRGVATDEFPKDFPVRETALAIQGLLVALNVMSKFQLKKNELTKMAKHQLKSLGVYNNGT